MTGLTKVNGAIANIVRGITTITTLPDVTALVVMRMVTKRLRLRRTSGTEPIVVG
jgi:hypothetical protein